VPLDENNGIDKDSAMNDYQSESREKVGFQFPLYLTTGPNDSIVHFKVSSAQSKERKTGREIEKVKGSKCQAMI
jgi:hypothetical protein